MEQPREAWHKLFAAHEQRIERHQRKEVDVSALITKGNVIK
jgi:hypothetical protein